MPVSTVNVKITFNLDDIPLAFANGIKSEAYGEASFEELATLMRRAELDLTVCGYSITKYDNKMV